ncbi:hypothetical protein NPIL_109791 [Nephila pilipes]|uniref:Uncharacterized protein n=1 Tax=Nephila pilipes TaxID=299642 RepID=A0A8X6TE19_NEPPI|nr:hypothetical protein NPIL_109791 [Nephila pilipes]
MFLFEKYLSRRGEDWHTVIGESVAEGTERECLDLQQALIDKRAPQDHGTSLSSRSTISHPRRKMRIQLRSYNFYTQASTTITTYAHQRQDNCMSQ